MLLNDATCDKCKKQAKIIMRAVDITLKLTWVYFLSHSIAIDYVVGFRYFNMGNKMLQRGTSKLLCYVMHITDHHSELV